MAYTLGSLWQSLSRICIVGTDQVPIGQDLRAHLAALGLDTSLSDTELLQKALVAVGLQVKAKPQFQYGIPAAAPWQNTGGWHDITKPSAWFAALLHPQQRTLLALTIQRLCQDKVLFPAAYIPDLAEVLHDQDSQSVLPWLDGRVVWFCQALGKTTSTGEIIGHRNFAKIPENPLGRKLHKYFFNHPQGQKQRMAMAWSAMEDLPEAELEKQIMATYRKTKSSHRAALAPILYLLPEAGADLRTLIERIILPPLGPDDKVDIWLKKVFPAGALTDALAMALLSEKQAGEKEMRILLMAQLIACLPPDAWAEYQISLAQLQRYHPLWSRELGEQCADYQDIPSSLVWFKSVLAAQTYRPAQLISETSVPSLQTLLPREFVLDCFQSATHFGHYSAEVMDVLLPALKNYLPTDALKNMALLWLRTATHPDFEPVFRTLVMHLPADTAQLLVDYYEEHAQLYWFSGKQNLVTELRRFVLLQHQIDRWLNDKSAKI
jgi:hypothetical protein